MDKVDPIHLKESYLNSKRRLFFLDYEGTLVPSRLAQENPAPFSHLNELLFSLSSDPQNQVVLLSDQTKENLEDWFVYLPLTLAAENGGFFRTSRNQWQMLYKGQLNWKATILHALSTLSLRYKGSVVEKKHFSFSWNYRSIVDKISQEEMRQFQVALRSLASKYQLLLHENNYVIEFGTPEVRRGKFAAEWLAAQGNFDFILAIGNDWHDEDLFHAIGKDYFTIRVGHSSSSSSKYFLENQNSVLPFLTEMLKPREQETSSPQAHSSN